MPSFGLKQRVGVALLTATMFALLSSAASANPARVWACHGPNGESIGTKLSPRSDHGGSVSGDCRGDGPSLKLGDTPVAGSFASVSVEIPGTASRIEFTQTAHGSATGARYVVSFGSYSLERSLDNLPAEFDVSGSGTLTITLICGSGCTPGAGPVSVDIASVRAFVDDTRAPYGISRNANSPVNTSATMFATALEEDVGFSRAEVVLASTPDGTPLLTRSEPIGKCKDLTPGEGALDLPLDDRCVTGSVDQAVTVDTSSFDEGVYYWSMRVYDAVGNPTVLRSAGQAWEPFEVWHPVLGSSTQELRIGSGSAIAPDPQPNGKPPGTGGAGSIRAGTCRSPRLSVTLAQKPLRVTRNAVVLRYGKRYRFTGRLTCVVNGRRISAPKRTKVELLNKVGKKTVRKTGPKIADKGRFKISLKYPVGSRTLTFRFRNAGGQRSQVSIKIKVEKKRKKKAGR